MKVKAKITYVGGGEETLTILDEHMTIESRWLILEAYDDVAMLARRRAIDISIIKDFFICEIPEPTPEPQKDCCNLFVIMRNGRSHRYFHVDPKSVEYSEDWITFRYGDGDSTAGICKEYIERYELEKVGPDV